MKKQKYEKDMRPFAEKHPKLNLLLGLLIILLFFALMLTLGILVGTKLGDVILWLAGIVSKLDAVIIVALITGAVSITGVILSSIVSKRIEYKKSRQEYLAQKREAPYGQFVDMVYKLKENGKKKNYSQKDMIADIEKFSKEITLWGSPQVVKKWVEFREASITASDAADNLFILEDIMNEMRKDLGLRKIKKGNLLAFFINDIKDFIKK